MTSTNRPPWASAGFGLVRQTQQSSSPRHSEDCTVQPGLGLDVPARVGGGTTRRAGHVEVLAIREGHRMDDTEVNPGCRSVTWSRGDCWLLDSGRLTAPCNTDPRREGSAVGPAGWTALATAPATSTRAAGGNGRRGAADPSPGATGGWRHCRLAQPSHAIHGGGSNERGLCAPADPTSATAQERNRGEPHEPGVERLYHPSRSAKSPAQSIVLPTSNRTGVLVLRSIHRGDAATRISGSL